MEPITFVTLAFPGKPITEPLMLAESIREFGGELADCPIIFLFPQYGGDFDVSQQRVLRKLRVETIPFVIAGDEQEFPFSAKVEAAAAAEKALAGKSELLAWLDSDTLVVNDLKELLLLPGKVIGCRPVHHKLLGLKWGELPDAFWHQVYQAAGAQVENNHPPMLTNTGEKIRPYLNAGSFVLLPERGIVSRWRQVFNTCIRSKEFLPFFQQNELYRIFLHQALFTIILLNMVETCEMQVFSSGVNYPLHLHNKIPETFRAKQIKDLVTVRYEEILSDPDWRKKYLILDPISGWIEETLKIAC